MLSVLYLLTFYSSGMLLYYAICPITKKIVVKGSDREEITKMDECKEYFLRQKARYDATFGNSAQSFVNWNENIASCFYEKEWYSGSYQRNTELENQWKQRILMESTPQGTIVMYYDVFKNAFSFYSDLTVPDYFLNAIAMKYVTTYRCRDFYVDERTSFSQSPLVEFLIPSLKIDPFLAKDKKIVGKLAKHPILCKNNFIRLGKIADFSIIQRSPKKHSNSILFADKKTGYDHMFSGEHRVQQHAMSYADFKKKMKEKVPLS